MSSIVSVMLQKFGETLPSALILTGGLCLVFALLSPQVRAWPIRKMLSSAALLLWFVTILIAVFVVPFEDDYRPPSDWMVNFKVGLVWQRRDMLSIMINFFMFMPLGILMPMVFPKINRVYKVLLITLLLSATIEVVQFLLPDLGRCCDVDDTINNVAGACAGFALYVTVRWPLESLGWVKTSHRPSLYSRLFCLVLTAAVAAAGVYLKTHHYI
ncbi:MAG: VanZ family protein [Christensenellales bacterium]|jgi:glycopeptide antibiotics resistance protein